MAITLGTKASNSGYSVVLYGAPQTGKTTTLALDPEFRYCVLDFDKNSTTLQSSKHVTVIGLDTFEDYLQVKQAVQKGELEIGGQKLKMDFDCYVIDSMTAMEEKIKSYVVRVYAPNRRREIASKFGAQSDWGDLQDIEIEQIRDWQALTKRPDNPVNVLWIGHDMTVTNELGQAEATALMLQGKYASPKIGASVDAMFYMFKTVKDGKTYRGVYTENNGIVRASARMPLDQQANLKNVIVNPKWSEIFKILGFKKK